MVCGTKLAALAGPCSDVNLADQPSGIEPVHVQQKQVVKRSSAWTHYMMLWTSSMTTGCAEITLLSMVGSTSRWRRVAESLPCNWFAAKLMAVSAFGAIPDQLLGMVPTGIHQSTFRC
jgi:hypothetical protein